MLVYQRVTIICFICFYGLVTYAITLIYSQLNSHMESYGYTTNTSCIILPYLTTYFTFNSDSTGIWKHWNIEFPSWYSSKSLRSARSRGMKLTSALPRCVKHACHRCERTLRGAKDLHDMTSIFMIYPYTHFFTRL